MYTCPIPRGFRDKAIALYSCRLVDKYIHMFFSNTGCFTIFSMVTDIYNKKTKGPTLMELFTATGKLKKFFDNWRCSM